MSLSRTQHWLQTHRKDGFGFPPTSFRKKATTISVSSGKGGVGKTSVAILTSKMLSRIGRRVLLIDCDFNLSNTSVKLGLPLNDNFASLLTMRKSFSECLVCDGNFHLLSGCNGSLELANGNYDFDKIVLDIIAEHEKEYDFIVLDLPAGVDNETLNLSAFTDYRFVVVTPDSSSITDAYSLMKLLMKKNNIDCWHLLVNKVGDIQQGKRVIKNLSETVDRFLGGTLKVLGTINYVNLHGDKFDQVLIRADDEIFGNFSKVINKLADENPCGWNSILNVPQSTCGIEHDVRI